MTFPMAGWRSAGRDCPLSYSIFDHLQRVSHAAIIENKRLGEVLAWIKQPQDKHPHYRDNLAGPRRSNQKAGLMKDRVDRLVQGKNQVDAPPAGAAAAAIPASTQRRPRLRQKLPSDILTLQSKGHLNLVATLGLGIDWSANEIIPCRGRRPPLTTINVWSAAHIVVASFSLISPCAHCAHAAL